MEAEFPFIIRQIVQYYLEYLNRYPIEKEVKFYLTKLKSGKIHISDIENLMKNSEEYKKLITLEQSKIELPLINTESQEYKQIQQKSKGFDIKYFEKKVHSQNGEDGILEFIFSIIGTTNKFFVEFGVEDGMECNTRYLQERKGWNGLMMDIQGSMSPHIKKEFVTAENVNNLFRKYSVPSNFDLLSIDVDFNDYWIWKAIHNYFPRVIIIEYNSTYPPTESKVVSYEPEAKWDGTNYFGASLLALVKLGISKDYTLVGCDSTGTNAFFIRDEIVNIKIKKRNIIEIYQSPKHGQIVNGVCIGYPPSNRKMIEV